jgi:hypothetical protein
MILVKSLIWLFLILLGFYAYDHLHLLSYFDGREGFQRREGFQQAKEETDDDDDDDDDKNETIIKASKSLADQTIEMKFSETSPANTHKKLTDDATAMSDLQEQMNELLKLKDEVMDINAGLKK